MHTRIRTFVARCTIAASLVVPALAAHATLATFNLRWEGTPPGGQPVTATGRITFDTDVLPRRLSGSSYPSISLPHPAVTDLEITVIGSQQGDGTFTLEQYDSLLFFVGGSGLDLSRELIGQVLDNGLVFGPSSLGGVDGASGGFELNNDSGPGSLPESMWWFNIFPAPDADGSQYGLTMVSFAPAVPEPTGAALLLAGLGLVAARGRARRGLPA